MSTLDEPTSTPDLFTPFRGRMVVIAALNLAAGVATVVPAVCVVELVRTLLPAASGQAADHGRAWTVVVVAAVSLVVRAALLVLAGAVSHVVDNDLQLSIRRRLVEHTRRLPLGWFDSAASGGVKKAVENDVAALHQLVAHSIQDVVLAITVPVLSLVYLLVVDWRLALLSLVPVLAVAVTYPVMMRDFTTRSQEYDAALTGLNRAAVEFVQGIAVVKTYGRSGRSHERFRTASRRYATAYGDWMAATVAPQTVVELVTAPLVVLVLLAGAGTWWVVDGSLAPVDLVPALLLGLGLTAPYLQLGFTTQFLREATKARRSIEALLATPTIRVAVPGTLPTGTELVMEHVTFGYAPGVPVLHDVSATFAPGTVTALVGPSGSGKSTLARLLPRFFDVTSGSVRLGGQDVRDLAPRALYAAVGFVFQDPYLLRTTVRDNIRLARPDASEEQVVRAAQAAQVHDRILALPRGYDSVIGEDAHLSGGEQQRVSIARGLLTDAPVLVLDEATAFADPDSEAAIQEALSELARGRTVVVIAHRLHTITHADQILVLDRGRVVERGTHDALARAGGLYQDLWTTYEGSRKETTR